MCHWVALAEQAHVSPFHFARQFLATIGVAPHQFVLRQRIQKALRLMRAGKLPPLVIWCARRRASACTARSGFPRASARAVTRFTESGVASRSIRDALCAVTKQRLRTDRHLPWRLSQRTCAAIARFPRLVRRGPR